MEKEPFESLRERAVPSARRFRDALEKDSACFILECKKASPSGLIRANFDIDEIAGAYAGFADAVSVLVDEPFFQGSFEYLERARAALDQPILCKDFVINPYQVSEARVHGADAVLLMLSVLDDETYTACANEAGRLSMDALTEVHGEDELERAVALGAPIIGINNRNLRTLEVDINTASKLADRVPSDRTLVCESGIGSREDVLNMEGRADAFLVGGMLMKAPRIDLAVRGLLYGAVKICGLSSPEDAAEAFLRGASFGGVIFAAESPRKIDEALALEISRASAPPLVGVFVNEDKSRIVRLAAGMNLAAVQLHGEETGEDIAMLRRELPARCEIWKALRVRDRLPDTDGYGADCVLLDAHAGNLRGGAGVSFDWSLLNDCPDKSRIIAAGGINPENARRASRLGCRAVDVNSGVEYPGAPGKKDHDKMKKLFGNIKIGRRRRERPN
jgi:indole-3-glycerol phosphate synthase/phosphoribosylanthranilate isomerase